MYSINDYRQSLTTQHFECFIIITCMLDVMKSKNKVSIANSSCKFFMAKEKRSMPAHCFVYEQAKTKYIKYHFRNETTLAEHIFPASSSIFFYRKALEDNLLPSNEAQSSSFQFYLRALELAHRIPSRQSAVRERKDFFGIIIVVHWIKVKD